MPQIFNDTERDEIRISLIENGFELIKKYGLKKTSIGDITQKTGIATGTFYNFFKTKEEFVYQMVVYKRGLIKAKFFELVEANEADRENMQRYLKIILTGDYNLFMYLNDGDIAQLQRKWPAEYWKNETNDEKTTKMLLSHLSPLKKDCNWKVVANLMKSISIVIYSKVRLHEESFDETIDVLIKSLMDYIFE